jgi:hypothetical protein
MTKEIRNPNGNDDRRYPLFMHLLTAPCLRRVFPKLLDIEVLAKGGYFDFG